MYSDVLVGGSLSQDVGSLEVIKRERAPACQFGSVGLTQLFVDEWSDVLRKITHAVSSGQTSDENGIFARKTFAGQIAEQHPQGR
jgi:hypothetical protein